jgi:hypothetical protein
VSTTVPVRPEGTGPTEAEERLARALARRRRRNRGGNAENPWQTRDLVRSLWVTTIGAVGIFLCWYGAGGEEHWSDQLPWLVGGIAGTVLGLLGMVGWLLSGFRTLHAEEWAARRELQAVLDTSVAGAAHAEQLTDAVFVTGPGVSHYHRPDCPLVRGKPVTPLGSEAIHGPVRTRCGVCSP